MPAQFWSRCRNIVRREVKVLRDRAIEKTCRTSGNQGVLPGGDGAPYFVLHAGNNLVIGRSEMYSSREAMHKGMASVKTNAQAAEIVDLSTHVPA